MISKPIARFACPVLMLVGLGVGAADEPAPIAPIPGVPLPITVPRRLSRVIALTGVDTPGDPGVTPPSAADSPTASSGPFDAPRSDAGGDADIGTAADPRPRRRPANSLADRLPNPLRGTPAISPEATGTEAMKVLATLLPGRSDTPFDWRAPVEPLHQPCEPRALPPCVPPPPCHPSDPPNPFDLVGMHGYPSCGPIYRGPCEPRAGTPHHGMFAWYHRLHDRFVDHFYKWK